MSRRWQMLFGLGAGLLVAGLSATTLTGCSNAAPASSRPAASTLKPGLNVLVANDPTVGFTAAYVAHGRVVYVESRVGALKPKFYQDVDPNEPLYEMDLRFVDQDNHTFAAQRGGDSFADPTWKADLEASKYLPPTAYANRALDFQIAREAAASIHGALPAGFQDHVYHMDNYAKMPVPADDPDLAAHAAIQVAPLAAQLASDQVTYGTFQYTSYSAFITQKASKSQDVLASHSATYMYVDEGYFNSAGSFVNVGVVLAVSACNHGPCFNTMSYDCSVGYSNWYYDQAINGESNGNTTGANDGSGGCQTAYNWYSGIGSHLCNDDAAYELFQTNNHPNYPNGSFAIYNQGSHCDGWSCGQSPSNYSCGYSGSLSGDWNTPNCGSTNF